MIERTGLLALQVDLIKYYLCKNLAGIFYSCNEDGKENTGLFKYDYKNTKVDLRCIFDMVGAENFRFKEGKLAVSASASEGDVEKRVLDELNSVLERGEFCVSRSALLEGTT